MKMDLNSNNYYLSFQNKIVDFQSTVGGVIEGGHVKLTDSHGVEITFFRMGDNHIHNLKPTAGLFAYGRVKENNQVEIIYVDQTNNFSEMAFPPRLEKALLVESPYKLFIAIAPEEDQSFLIEVAKRLHERYPEKLG
jgi:hypothetical protein